jgi:hypothetical protein
LEFWLFDRDEGNHALINAFSCVYLKGIRIVWEVRYRKVKSLASGIIIVAQDYNIIHCEGADELEKKILLTWCKYYIEKRQRSIGAGLVRTLPQVAA